MSLLLALTLVLALQAADASDVAAYYHLQRYNGTQPSPTAPGSYYANVSNASSVLPPAGPALSGTLPLPSFPLSTTTLLKHVARSRI